MNISGRALLCGARPVVLLPVFTHKMGAEQEGGICWDESDGERDAN